MVSVGSGKPSERWNRSLFPDYRFLLTMDHLNVTQISSLYGGVNMMDYGGGGGSGGGGGGGGEAGVSPMMALITQPHGGGGGGGMMTNVPSSFSSFHGPAECLLSSALFHPEKLQSLMPGHPSHGVVSVKTEGYPNVESRFELQRERAGNSVTEAESPRFSITSSRTSNTSSEEGADAMKAKILAHPQYPCLLEAYIHCQKVGAPDEVVDRLEAVRREYENRSTINIGMDPELDRFMEAYCEMLNKYHEELTKPFKEAMAFFSSMESQLNSLCKGTIRVSPSGNNKTEGGGSSDGEDCSTGEMDYQEVDHHGDDRELKDHLLRKYSGYLSSLKQEFSKRKKKGKLPKEARQKLLDWWNLHCKWPYPSENEKVALADSTGLDQKQINNWFINQRKRHWKPPEDVQFVVMDGHNPHNAALYMDRHLMNEGSAFHLNC